MYSNIIRKVERQVKVLIKHLVIFNLLPSKKFLPISKFSCWTLLPKTKGTKTKAARCLFFLMSFPFLYILNSLQSSLTVYILPILYAAKETAEIETGMAEKFSWDQANIRQKLGLVCRNRKKISQIIIDYFYLPFFLLIYLCVTCSDFFPAWFLPLCTQQMTRLFRYNLQLRWIKYGACVQMVLLSSRISTFIPRSRDSMHRERLIMIRVIRAIFALQQGLKHGSNNNLSFKDVILKFS